MDIREKRKKTAKERTEMQDNRKLSTDAALSSARPKKGKGKEERSPYNPLKEKREGKETSPGSSLNPLKPARAYASTHTRVRTKRRLPCTCSYSEAGDAAFQHRNWQQPGISRRTFFHAKKKVKSFWEADKQRAKSTSGRNRQEKSLH